MSPGFRTLPGVARIYIATIVFAGSLAIAHSLTHLSTTQFGMWWVILAALTVLTGSLNLKIPSINAHLSVSESFVFASILLFGTPSGTATVLVECLAMTMWLRPRGRTIYRILFNTAAPSLAIWIAGTLFYSYSGIEPYSRHFTPLATLFLPFLGFIATYFLLNSSLVAVAVALEQHRSPLRVWRDNFAWLSVNYFSGAYVAALIVTYTQKLDISALAIVVPLIAVSYITFKTAIGRAEDSYNHLAQLNRLYLSTIETLAMAIDAKDQITHGHIRRVQSYAVGLAKHIGISDDKLLKAIEAAALLHDMGKLAVPEHILNKPGKLTVAEFEKMKLHASVGADILSSIDFPYPVVPIVRHHHENWNGTGYPDGIRGTEIPIGARILSVVDCFDALTSDRPYRPRMTDADAVAILLDRRGSMYDPLVVDTFIRVHDDIAATGPVPVASYVPIRDVAQSPRDKDTEHQRQDRALAASGNRSSSDNPATRDLPHSGRSIANYLLQHRVPYTALILFQYDANKDELNVRHTSGEAGYLVQDIRMAPGDRLSGWVAANRKAIVNSDPALDLGDIARATVPPLRSTLSVPLMLGNELLGVLSLYSTIDSYDEDHLNLVRLAISLHLGLGDRQSTHLVA